VQQHVKHSIPITLLLVILFAAAQIIGLGLLAADIDAVVTTDSGLTIERGTTALGERPTTEGFESFLYLLIGIGIGTALVLLLIRLKAYNIWKIWFLVAIWFSLSVALGVFVPALVALIICLPIAAWKVYWPNPVIHNIAEIFMYAGLAVLLVPILDLKWAIILLVAISIYDMIAVWYSKHMVVMAQEQAKSNLFAGLYIPKSPRGTALVAPPPPRHEKREHKTGAAILGGGDIAFPLLFSGVTMDWLIVKGASVQTAFLQCTIITLAATGALLGLFAYAERDKFYPAMPFLTAGCLIGLAIVAVF
jgi:presenilin-like A22 family membrane protease